MEHVDVILKIIEAEKDAQRAANEAMEEKRQLHQKLAEEKAELHEQFMERAKRRIGIVRQHEQEEADEQIARLDAELTQNRAALQRRFAENRDAWADELFAYVTGVG